MSEKAGRKLALLIGINHYHSLEVHNLRGCVEDVRLVEVYLREAVGISDICKLTATAPIDGRPVANERLPTLENVVEAFESLATEARKGDLVFIHYSGHGSRRPTVFPDLKINDLDEALVLVRETDDRVDDLRDVEIAFLLKKIADKGAVVTIVLDCCHSGGAVRAETLVRGVGTIPEDAFHAREPIYPCEVLETAWSERNSGHFRGAAVVDHWMTASNGIEFLAACRATEQAQEIETPGPRGLLTHCLIGILDANRPHLDRLTCDMVYNLVSREVSLHKRISGEQNVVFGGKRNRTFFGTASMPQFAVRVTGVIPLASGGVLVQLDSGRAHGVSEGDMFAIYPSDKPFTTIMDYNLPLATCRVSKADDLGSEGRVPKATGDVVIGGDGCLVRVGCKAVKQRDILKSYILSSKTATVLPGEDQAQENAIREAEERITADGKGIELSPPDSSPFFEIRVNGSQVYEISFVHNEKTGTRATVSVTSLDNLLTHLTHLAIYYNLLNLSNNHISDNLTVELVGCLDRDSDPPPPRRISGNNIPNRKGLKKIVTADPYVVDKGDHVQLQIRNMGFDPVFIEVLVLEPSWKVSRIYPGRDHVPVQVSPNDGVSFYVTMAEPETAQNSHHPEIFDVLVVLATTGGHVNFPEVVLPELGETSNEASQPINETGFGRMATVLETQFEWAAKRLHVLAIEPT